MKRLILLCLTLLSSGCATLERHPVWTAVGTAIIVGSIAASVQHHHDQQQQFDICNKVEPDGRHNGIVGCAVR
jgi:hypothetical protein